MGHNLIFQPSVCILIQQSVKNGTCTCFVCYVVHLKLCNNSFLSKTQYSGIYIQGWPISVIVLTFSPHRTSVEADNLSWLQADEKPICSLAHYHSCWRLYSCFSGHDKCMSSSYGTCHGRILGRKKDFYVRLFGLHAEPTTSVFRTE